METVNSSYGPTPGPEINHICFIKQLPVVSQFKIISIASHPYSDSQDIWSDVK
jgi:hypothetical protein